MGQKGSYFSKLW